MRISKFMLLKQINFKLYPLKDNKVSDCGRIKIER